MTNQRFSSKEPPILGAFPLDHEGDCKALVAQYLECMRSSIASEGGCKKLMKSYLECRIKNGLMDEIDDWRMVGLGDDRLPLVNKDKDQQTKE